MDERLFIAYSRFEAKLKEYERARAIYKYALDRLPRSKAQILHKAYTTFEKQFGDREGVEDVILSRRRVQYEEKIKENPKNYDVWFDYARLEETSQNVDRVREVYEQAIAQIPPTQEKRHWRRYIYLWIFYALWEEMDNGDIERARAIYAECLKLIPHKKFTFAKIWLLKAHFEVRQGQLPAARKTLGQAIGLCPKDRLFKGYIALELKLFEFVRCRTLYEKYIAANPANTAAWIKFAELERGLDDLDRTRAIFELAVQQPTLDMPELLWKAYIDFEEEEGEYDRTRALYERLLEKTDHVKVWISLAHFEINVPEPSTDSSNNEAENLEEDEDSPITEAAISRARAVFDRANTRLRSSPSQDLQNKESRLALLTAWKSFEATHGTAQELEAVEAQMPRKVKRRRKVEADDGGEDSFEEYVDWIFPADDEGAKRMGGLLARAARWKEGGGKVN